MFYFSICQILNLKHFAGLLYALEYPFSRYKGHYLYSYTNQAHVNNARAPLHITELNNNYICTHAAIRAIAIRISY